MSKPWPAPSGPNWEYRLTVALLRAGLARMAAQHRRAISSVARGTLPLGLPESLALANRLLSELIAWVAGFEQFFPGEWEAACGAPGQPGDAGAIEKACTHIIQHTEELIDWEECVAAALPAPACAGIFRQLRGCTSHFLARFDELVQMLEKVVQAGSGSYRFTLVLDTPPALEGLALKITRAQRAEQPFWQRLPDDILNPA